MRVLVRTNMSLENCREKIEKLGVITYQSKILDDLIFLETDISLEDLERESYIKSAKFERKGSLI
jgi:hypothetical protein